MPNEMQIVSLTQKLRGSVGAAIIDHDDFMMELLHLGKHVLDVLSLVENRYYDEQPHANAPGWINPDAADGRPLPPPRQLATAGHSSKVRTFNVPSASRPCA
jgi:hypothetical protein